MNKKNARDESMTNKASEVPALRLAADSSKRSRSLDAGRVAGPLALGLVVAAKVYATGGPPTFLALGTPNWAWPIPFASCLAGVAAVLGMRHPRVHLLLGFVVAFMSMMVWAALPPLPRGSRAPAVLATLSWIVVVVLPLTTLASILAILAVEAPNPPRFHVYAMRRRPQRITDDTGRIPRQRQVLALRSLRAATLAQETLAVVCEYVAVLDTASGKLVVQSGGSVMGRSSTFISEYQIEGCEGGFNTDGPRPRVLSGFSDVPDDRPVVDMRDVLHLRLASQTADDAELTTPVSEKGISQFFEGLAALESTLKYSAPGQAAVSITPSLAGLIKQFCGRDPRYGRVMANIWIRVEDYHAKKNAR